MATVKIGSVRVSLTRIAQLGMARAYEEAREAQQRECEECAEAERRRRRIIAAQKGRK